MRRGKTRTLGTRNMRTDNVEIYSDAANAAVMKHPGRHFPGVLVQGDTLHTLCVAADAACEASRGRIGEDAYTELNNLRDHLWELLTHYKQVLSEHRMPLPFNEVP
jgi:hypothetical protein